MHRSALALLPAGLLALLVASAGAAEPAKKRPTDEARGLELYERHCVACHGAYNGGKGPATGALVHKVPDLAGKLDVDDEAIQVVLRGKGAMPAYEQTFDRFDAKRVLTHMAALRAPDPNAPAPEPTEAEDAPPTDAPPE